MKRQRIKLLIIALAAVLATLFSQGTLAYYSVIGKATNVVTSGDISLAIYEKTADDQDFPAEGVYVIPGDVVSKRVTVENVCGHPFYLRVKLVNGSTDQALNADDCLKVDLNTTDWTVGQDGFIYYNKILEPGQTTAPVFTEVEIVGEKLGRENIGTTLELTVKAFAVQSENNPAEHPWDAAGWPAE